VVNYRSGKDELEKEVYQHRTTLLNKISPKQVFGQKENIILNYVHRHLAKLHRAEQDGGMAHV
jgi:hypothetical protein